MLFFLLISIVCFTIPGIILLNWSSTKAGSLPKLAIGTTLGFVLFTLTAYLQMLLRVPILITLVIAFNILFILQFKKIKKNFLKINFSLKTREIVVALVFVVGVAGQLAIISPSGLYKNNEIIFYSSHGHDGTWHLALMNEIKKDYPLQNPTLAGEKLVNYHFFSDIAPSFINKYFHINPLDLYFRYFPLLFSLLLGSLIYLLTHQLTNSNSASIWAIIFTYFSGSFGYILTLARHQGLGGESLFWVSQIQSSSGNPPQIISLILLLLFLYLFRYLLETPSKKTVVTMFLCILIGGATIGFKSYAGVIILISTFITGVWQIIRSHQTQVFIVFLLSLILSLVLYLPNASNSTSFLIWEPWWFIRTMVVAPDRLDWLDLELRRQTYLAEGNWKRVIQVETIAFVIFLIGNLGMRFIGFWSVFKIIKSLFTDYTNLLIASVLFSSFMLPLLFLQKGVAGNSIQFMQYFLLIMGILGGITVSQIMKKFRLTIFKITLSAIIIILAVPTQIGLIYSFYSKPPLAKISAVELQALDFLKNKVSDKNIILTPPGGKVYNMGVPNIWAWSDTSYVSALSNKRTFLSDQEQAIIMGYNIQNRAKIQEQLFKETDLLIFNNLLKVSQINYLYFPKVLRPAIKLETTSLTKSFENNEIEIWQVN